MDTCTSADHGTRVNVCIPNHRAELGQSIISDSVIKAHSVGFGVNGIEAVNSRPMAVCRPIDVLALR